MRLVILGACPFPVPQGSQVFLQDTARALQDRGHDVHVVTYGYGLGDPPGDLRHHGSRPFGSRRTLAGPSLRKPLLDLALARMLRRVVREHTIDCVIAHNYEALMAAWAARVRPIVYTAHNAMADELPHYFREQRWARHAGAWIDRRFPPKACRIIVPHAALRDYLLQRGCDADRVDIIPPPAPLSAFAPQPTGGEQPPVVYTGNLDAYQNLPFLERVAASVRRAIPGARFLVASANSRRLSWTDSVVTPDFASLQAVLNQDCVIVCPRTSWSGYPIKLLNAMAAGRPIVACRSAGHPLTHDVNGLLTDDNDTDQFAAAVVRLLQSPEDRARLGRAARAAAEANHDPAAYADAAAAVCAKAIDR